MAEKTIPYSIEAEEALLGNILIYESAMQECMDADLKDKDFYVNKHQLIFNAAKSLFEKKQHVDMVSLPTFLRDFSILDKVGGYEYLTQLTAATISANNTKSYIDIIKNKSLARNIIKVSQEIADDAYDGSSDTQAMLEKVENRIISITRNEVTSDFLIGEQVFTDTIDHIQKVSDAGSDITGVRSLFSALDKATAGFQPGDLIILAARPSMGKTALALNIATNAASVNPGSIAIFSLEMPAQQIATRMLAAKSKVEIQKLRTGKLNNEDWNSINEAYLQLKSQHFYIDDRPGIKVRDMLAKCRKLARENDLFMIVVDYIQLIQSSEKSDSRQEEVSNISRQLKAMARELNVPVIALSQLSRSLESRQDKRPMLSDLRESGALEQDADLVMFLYREAYYNRNQEVEEAQLREDVELIIAKHRNGPTGTINLAFEKEINAFYTIASKKEEAY